jgi:Tol biopolymer transport system component
LPLIQRTRSTQILLFRPPRLWSELRHRVSARVLGALGLALCLALTSCQVLNKSGSTQGLSGRIAWPKDGDLWLYDLASRQQTKITNLPSGAAVTGATWAPDGQHIVFAQFWRRPNERSSGADLMIANADGSNPHSFADRDAPNTVLETPEFGASGYVYYTTRQVSNGRETQTIVRQKEGGQPEKLMDNAYDPAVSPDESTLIYVRSTRAGQSMMKKALAEAGDGCELVSDQVFQYLSLPRVAPDGKRVAFGGSGEPAMGPSGCGGDPRSTAAAGGASPTAAGSVGQAAAAGLAQPGADGPGAGLNLAALLQPEVAYAHGLPADVYSVNLDGSAMVRIADIKDDDPTVAWSSDGAKLAIFGVAALYLVDGKGGPTDKLVDQGGYGGLDWTK